MKSLLIAAFATAATLTLTIGPASAGDIQGDAYECRELWSLRNEIYKANGYCFKTAKAMRYFGNAGCQYDSETEVPLSRSERQQVRMIKASERRQHC